LNPIPTVVRRNQAVVNRRSQPCEFTLRLSSFASFLVRFRKVHRAQEGAWSGCFLTPNKARKEYITRQALCKGLFCTRQAA